MTVTEGNSGTVNAVFTVSLSSPRGQTVTANYSTANNTATAGSDYASASGTLTFSPGATTRPITITVNGDTLDEANETFFVNLANASNATIADGQGLGTISDDDPRPTVRFNAAAYSVNEGANSATIVVTLSAASGLTVKVNFATSNGTALAGSDYIATSGTLTFPPGVTSQTFTVGITNDALDERNETISLTLSSPNNATLGAPNPATLTIVDNDAPPKVQFSAAAYSVNENTGSATLTATLSTVSGLTATVNVTTRDGTATAGSDYTPITLTLTFAPGVTNRTFTIPIIDDAAIEIDETLTVTLAAPVNATLGTLNPASLTILDNEAPPNIHFSASAYQVNENAGPATLGATLSLPSPRTVTVRVTTSDGTATAGLDYTPITTTLTFAPGVTSQTFTIPIINDPTDEPNETLSVTLSDVSHAVLGSPNPALLTITDEDPPPPCAGCFIFGSADVPRAILDQDPTGADSTLVISLPGVVIDDLTVRIDELLHTYTGDLQISLIHPNGTTVVLVAGDLGGDGDNFIYTVLNDSYPITLDQGAPPFTGNFHPDTPLSRLRGLPVTGTWKLHAVDRVAGDTGSLNAWALEVRGIYPLYLPIVRR